MDIVEIKQPAWDKDLLWIELEISNICNYKCWYCFPGYNDGSIKWPDYDLLVQNLSHLIDYYKNNTNKKKFAIHLLGGEVTHWKRFKDFANYFKKEYNANIVLTTNGSKSVEWWNTVCECLDSVHVSVHREYANPNHISEVADFLYEKSVYVEANIFLDTFAWDACIDISNKLKLSKHTWPINFREINHHVDRSYTPEQDVILKTPVRTSSDNKTINIPPMSSDTEIVDNQNVKRLVGYKELMSIRKIKFKGWECDLGVDWIAVHADGSISGVCRNPLYDHSHSYNIFDIDFKNKFTPIIKPTMCVMDFCWCILEVNMPKRKVIPIYEN